MVQRGDPTQGDPERSLEDRDDALRGGMKRLPTLRTRGTAAFEQAFARRMLRLRKTVELNATFCSNDPLVLLGEHGRSAKGKRGLAVADMSLLISIKFEVVEPGDDAMYRFLIEVAAE